jgi:hypothetical protein
MMPAWYLRMNQRERLLAASVAGIVFLLINLWIWSALFGMAGKAHAAFSARRTARAEQIVYLKEYKMWANREKWLEKTQPVSRSEVDASTLLDQVKQVASKHAILLENPAIGLGDAASTHQSVFASVETKCAWPPLVHFLYDMQRPEAFIVFESVNLIIDSSDPTIMRGKFKIAKWFAPHRGK